MVFILSVKISIIIVCFIMYVLVKYAQTVSVQPERYTPGDARDIIQTPCRAFPRPGGLPSGLPIGGLPGDMGSRHGGARSGAEVKNARGAGLSWGVNGVFDPATEELDAVAGPPFMIGTAY
jgi:hypothetical protein